MQKSFAFGYSLSSLINAGKKALAARRASLSKRRARRYRQLFLENFEARCVLSSDMWVAVFRDFPASGTLDDQAHAGQQLLANYGVLEDNVRVLQALDFSGSFVLQTAEETTEEDLESQLEDIPGFAIVENFDEVRQGGTFTPGGNFSLISGPDAPLADDPTDPLPPGGTWTNTTVAPTGIETMMLLSDGSVLAQANNVTNNWYKLTPSPTLGYAGGTWSQVSSMGLQRLYGGSNVLPDGRVFFIGGEYSGPLGTANWTNTGEIYDPVANTWTAIAPFPRSSFGDGQTAILPDGRILAGYLSSTETDIYDPDSNTWSPGGSKLHNDKNNEETWSLLPDGSILSYDIWSSISEGVGHAQRYIPATNTWVDAGTPPEPLSSSSIGFEFGPQLLLPDGRTFVVGATNKTALYTPSTNSWTAGPALPAGLGADDAPGAIMPNGHVIFAADTTQWIAPTRLFDFDPTTNSLTELTGQPGFPAQLTTDINHVVYSTRMLMLPTGQMLFSPGNGITRTYLFTPDGAPDASWRPTITSIASNNDGSYTLTGTQLNGISEGASYGDDAEMATNYPIVQLTSSTGSVYYGRTYEWSSTGVATGSLPVTTQFTLPPGLPAGSYSLAIVANGIASTPVSFNAPLTVNGTTPAAGSVVFSLTPAGYVVNFSSAVDPTSLQGSDLMVNGLPADSVILDGTHTSATFTFSVDPVTSQGVQSLTIAAGSISADGDPGTTISGYSATFRYDSPALSVTSTVPAANGLFTLPSPFNYVVNFNEPIAPNSLSTDDLTLTTGTVSSVVATGPSQATYTITNITAEGNITITLGAGKVTDAFGNPNTSSFPATYAIDVATAAFPAPLMEKSAAGSLIYDQSQTGIVTFAGDTDTFTIAVDPAQTITVVVTPTSASLQPSVQLLDSSSTVVGSAAAGAANQSAVIYNVGPTANGTYSIVVSGASSTTGNYTLQVILNAGVEKENFSGPANNTIGAAQDLSPSFINLTTSQVSAQRGAVSGQFKDDDDYYSFNLAAGQTVSLGMTTPGNTGAALFSNGRTTFTTGSGTTTPAGLVYADLNADGKLDMIVANATNAGAGTIGVRLGNGDGTFGAVTTNSSGGTNTRYLAVGDVNGDGKLDVVATNQTTNNVSLLIGNGLGGFTGAAQTFSVGTTPHAVVVRDINGDGFADVLVANSASGTVSVRRGQSGATNLGAESTFAVGTNPRGVAVGDVNADGKLDLVSANFNGGSASTISVLLGTGTGSFGTATSFSTGNGSWGVVLADFNGDGKLDAAASNQVGNTISVLLGTGGGSPLFNTTTNYSVVGSGPQSLAVGDVNGDGKLDLATANVASANASVLLGVGSGVFGTATTFGMGTSPNSVALADVNSDGVPDLSTADTSTASNTVSIRFNSKIQLQIVDSSGTVQATGVSAANLGAVINNFTAATAGTYYARLSGKGNTNYNLVVTRDAAFDTEPNDTSATAQPLGSNTGALGSSAQTVVAPSIVTTTDANFDNAYPFNIGDQNVSSMRYQQIYARSEFAQPGQITAIRFRRDSLESTFNTTGINVQINLGYSATAFASPSATFANNVGPGTTTVLNTTSLSLSSSSGANPRDFDIVIPLTTPFTYDPAQGDLLMDIFMRNAVITGQFDASTSAQQSTTRRIYATNVANLSGTSDTTGLVTRFDMAPNDDWYSFNVATLAPIRLETSTPSDGVNQFVNTFNPHIELYDPSNALVATGAAFDSRNEAILFTPATTGTYRVRVTEDSGSAGEYFVTRKTGLYWDPDGNPANNDIATGAGLGGVGNWDTTSAVWFNGVTDVAWNNASNDFAVFKGTTAGGTAGPVTLMTSITADALSFATTGYNIQNNTLTLSGGQIGISSGLTDTVTSQIAGTAGIATTDGGTLVLSNSANSYTGPTFVNAGTLRLGASNAIPATSAVTLSNTAGVSLNLNNNNDTIGSLSGTGRVATVNVTNGGSGYTSPPTVTFSGGSGTGATATANLLGGVVTSVTITNGGSGYLGAPSVTFSAPPAGGTTALGNSTIAVGALSLGSGILTTGGDNSSTSYAGIISGTGGITKSGTGTFTLGTQANTFTGQTMINSGTLVIGSIANLGSGTAAVLIGSSSPATLSYSSTGGSIGKPITVNGSGGGTIRTTVSTGTLTLSGAINTNGNPLTFDVAGTGTVTASGVISGTGSLTKLSSGKLTLTNSNTYSGITTISAGSVQLGSAGTAGTLGTNSVTNNGTLIFNRTNSLTVPNVISGTGALTQAGTGTTFLTAADTYSGTTTISAGTLQLGTGATTVTVGSGAIINNSALVINRGGSLTLPNIMSGAGSLSLIGPGTVIITAADTYSGTTTISSGTLQLGTGGSVVTIGGGQIVNNGALIINRAGTLTLGNLITGSGTLTKSGTGTLTLSNPANNFSGTTTVTAGTLNVTGNIAPSPAIITGGTLSGTGTTDGVTVNTGGTLSPGASLGMLRTGNFNLASGAIYAVELNGTVVGSGYDQTNVTGTVSLGGATLNASLGFSSAVGDSFVIINNDDVEAVSGAFNGLPEGAIFAPTGAPAGDRYQITYVGGTGNDVVITRVQTPTVTPPADQQAIEGVLAAISLGSFNDADGNPWTVNVDWGDASPHTTFVVSSAGSLGQQTHVYADQSSWTVTVTVTDASNLSSSASFSVNGADAAPMITAGNAVTGAPENASATNSGTFADYDDAVLITASFGTITQSGSQNGTWTWSGAGDDDLPYTVTITATNADGSTATTSFDVSFTDVAPTVTADSTAVIAPENALATDTGTFADYDEAVVITASLGTVTQSGSQNGTWTWSGTGDDDLPYTVTITATNADGSTSTTSFDVSFTDVPPTVSADNLLVTIDEAQTAINTGLFADYDDSVSISVSEGTIAQSGNTGGTWSWSNQYADNGSHEIVVTATDAGGSVTTTTFTVQVNNVAPTLAISGADEVDEGSSYTLALSSLDPGTDTINHWTINWGDDQTAQLVSGNPTFVTHIYADGNASSTYSITATATDEDGTFAAGNTVAVSVKNVAPAVSITAPAAMIPLADLTMTLSPVDVSAPDQAAGFTYLIDWGDGSQQTSSTATVTHAYATVGTKSIVVIAIDKDNGNSAPATRSVDIVYALPMGNDLLLGGTGAADEIVIAATDDGRVQIAMNGNGVGTFTVAGRVNVVNLGSTTDNLTFRGTSLNDVIDKVPGVITLSSPFSEVVAYTGDFSLVIDGGAGNDDITDPGSNTLILGGPGNDIITIDGSTNTGVVIDGGDGSDIYIVEAGSNLQAPVTISDSGATGADSVLLLGTPGSDTITQTSSGFNLDGATINVGTGLETATIDGGGGSDQVIASGTPAVSVQVQSVADMVIKGTSGDDQITFTPGDIAGQIVGRLNNVVVSRFSPTGRLIAYGGAGNDNIQVAASINLPAWLYGESGNDRLNAGNGGSLLIGGDGNDQLLGGGGRDVMIGGEGADQLGGNSNDDILIAGLTDQDSPASPFHDEFWSRVLEEWNSANSFATRIQNLRNGTGGHVQPTDALLMHVFDDASVDAIDFLNGSAGNDWLIFLAGEDKVTGQAEESN